MLDQSLLFAQIGYLEVNYVNHSQSRKFLVACSWGWLEAAQWILATYSEEEIQPVPSLLFYVCRENLLEMTQWLVRTFPTLVQEIGLAQLFSASCLAGSNEVAKWLLAHSLTFSRTDPSGISISSAPLPPLSGLLAGQLIVDLCFEGQDEILRWLVPRMKHIQLPPNLDLLLPQITEAGHLQLADWLRSHSPLPLL